MTKEQQANELLDQYFCLREIFELRDPKGILADLRSQLFTYGGLSDKQISLAYRLHQQLLDAAYEELEEREPCPEGRTLVSGVVLRIKVNEDTCFGPQYKMLVKDDRGFKVWGTLPSAFIGEEGDRIKFTATLQPHENDLYFGWANRPRLKG